MLFDGQLFSKINLIDPKTTGYPALANVKVKSMLKTGSAFHPFSKVCMVLLFIIFV